MTSPESSGRRNIFVYSPKRSRWTCLRMTTTRPASESFPNMNIQTDGQQIESAIRDFVATQLIYSNDGFHYADETSLLREGIIDSLGVVELVEFVQTQIGRA